MGKCVGIYKMLQKIITFLSRTKSFENNIFTLNQSFFLEFPNFYHSKILERNDCISLWIKPDERKINFYTNKNGLAGGSGFLGQLPEKYLIEFLKIYSTGAKFDCKIEEINFQKQNFKVFCKYVSFEEVEKERLLISQKNHEKLIKIIAKPYKPKLNFYSGNIALASIEGFNNLIDYDEIEKMLIKIANSVLLVKIENLEYFIENKIDYPYVKIFDQDDKFLFNFESHYISLTNIIRSHYSGYKLRIRNIGYNKYNYCMNFIINID